MEHRLTRDPEACALFFWLFQTSEPHLEDPDELDEDENIQSAMTLLARSQLVFNGVIVSYDKKVKALQEEVTARESELCSVKSSVDGRVLEEVGRLSAELTHAKAVELKAKEKAEIVVYGRDAARQESEELSERSR